jgi:hypothetical protein
VFWPHAFHNRKAMTGDFNNTGTLGISFRRVVSVKVIVWYNKIIVGPVELNICFVTISASLNLGSIRGGNQRFTFFLSVQPSSVVLPAFCSVCT